MNRLKELTSKSQKERKGKKRSRGKGKEEKVDALQKPKKKKNRGKKRKENLSKRNQNKIFHFRFQTTTHNKHKEKMTRKSTTIFSLIFGGILLFSLFFNFSFAQYGYQQYQGGGLPHDAMYLEQVQTLTFYGGRMTTSRRSSPVPQLLMVSSGDRYEVDPHSNEATRFRPSTVQCYNKGSDGTGERGKKN